MIILIGRLRGSYFISKGKYDKDDYKNNNNNNQ
jgi:hypothetical protein